MALLPVLVALPVEGQTSAGRDFWVTFIPNSVPSDQKISVIATGSSSATITVTNPLTNWSRTVSHIGGTKTYIELLGPSDIPSASPSQCGFHVTSTTDISLFASNYLFDSWDLCNVLPTNALGSEYIVQDYPNNSDYPGVVSIVATENNTVLSMTLPCTVDGLDLQPGSPYSVTLNAGQTLVLECGANDGFSGMNVSSNNKPFALFQGHTCARVASTSSQHGRDLLMEQATPLAWWGVEFVVLAEQNRREGDKLRITASADNTTVHITQRPDLTNNHIPLMAGQTIEVPLSSHSADYITATAPIYVCKYLSSYRNTYASSLGDPASVTIPPTNLWTTQSTFPVHRCNTDPYSNTFISDTNNYLDIVTTSPLGMTLDGVELAASSFTAFDNTPYYYRQTRVNIGAHELTCSNGTYYATVSGHGKWLAYSFLTGVRFDTISQTPQPPVQQSCPNHTTLGRDFWVSFIVNGGDQRPMETKLNATTETTCTVTVTNPASGWSQSMTVNAGSSNTLTLPNEYAIPEHYSTDELKSFHVTADADIQLTSLSTQLASSSAASIIPTSALDTRYIVLDYPADPTRTSITGASVTILTTQPNTTITYTPPCALYNDPGATVGVMRSHTIHGAGHTFTIMARDANASLCGMEINSDKPIAVFQGNQIAGVPHGASSSDMMCDQALPVRLWGKEYALVPTAGRSVGDRVRVVADNACSVTLSTGFSFALQDKGVYEFDLAASQPCILAATEPVSVGLCMKSSDYNGEPGDASLVMMTPTDRGLCHSLFSTLSTQRIFYPSGRWYVTVVTAQPSSMKMDNVDISSQFTRIGSTEYSYALINVASGTHSLDNSDGTFVAWTYGVGNVESYAYPLGLNVDTLLSPQPIVNHRDTVYLEDTTCQGKSYGLNGFNIDSSQTQTVGTLTVADSTITDTVAHYRILALTVLPTLNDTVQLQTLIGYPVAFADTTLSEEGYYVFRFTAANGCDSTVHVHLTVLLMPITVRDTAYLEDSICQGERYNQNGFNIRPSQTQMVGMQSFADSTIVDSVAHYRILTLTVLPTARKEMTLRLIEGSSVTFADSTLSVAGTYIFHLTATNGCDSMVTLHLVYEEPTITVRDTIFFEDSVCQERSYSRNGFNIAPFQTRTVGVLTFADSTIVDTVAHYRILTLTVRPAAKREMTISVMAGDSVFFADTTLSVAGTYTFHFTAANGCDSTVTLHLVYEETGITASGMVVCPNGEVTLTAHGAKVFRWAAEPPDPSLDAQQGAYTVTVYPATTTVYRMVDAAGQTIDSVTIVVSKPPTPCVNMRRDFIDFDNPSITINSCTQGAVSHHWELSDGFIAIRDRLHHVVEQPLPDSLLVTLTVCNEFQCCADTTFAMPLKIRSVWFPNVFTPDADINSISSFGCSTNCEVVEYHIWLYNRWGLLVWESDNVEERWDGTHHGEPVSQGAYVFHWEMTDRYRDHYSGTGTVTLLR